MSAHTRPVNKCCMAQFPPTIRESWGRSDALMHKETGYIPEWRRGHKDTHFDKAYTKGYYSIIWEASK